MRRLLFPRSAALVGLSERSSPEVVDNVLGREVSVLAVHPRGTSVRGIQTFASIAELPSAPELAFMLVGHREIEAAFEEALNAGIRAFVMPGLGNEAGREGGPIARRIAQRAQAAGACVVGPNCMGVAVPDGASFWIGSVPPTFVPGHVSVVVQSGSIGEALLALGPRVGFRCVVSSGGELVTDVADYCAFFADDEGTRAVGLFLESVRRPEAFARALGLLADAGKPVVCLKVGRSPGGARAVLAHSGAVVGSDVAFSAMLRCYGVIEVDDYPELVEVLEVLGRKRRPAGTRLGGVTNSGGEGALLADHADAAGLAFRPLSEDLGRRLGEAFPNYVAPQNPVDAWAIDEVERVFPGTLQLLAGSGEFDILVAQIDQSQYLGEPETENALVTLGALADAVEGTRIFPAVTSVQSCDAPQAVAQMARARDVALLRGSRYGMRALAAVARWRPQRPPEHSPRPAHDLTDLLRPGPMPEYESGAILERCGVPIARRLRATNPEAAAHAATEIGFPVVVKRDGPAHKSRDGGVILGLRDETAVRQAAARLGGPVLVAQQEEIPLELFIGMSRDPEVGPVLVVGLGGAAAEVLPGKVACIAPVGEEQALRLIDEAPVLSKLTPPGARGPLARVVAAIGALAVEHPDIAAMDVNPLLVGEHDVIAVDALVVVSGS
jgi:acetyltransferase